MTPKQELDHLTTSYSQLKQAQAKFRSCMSDIGELTASAKGRSFHPSLLSEQYSLGRSDLAGVPVARHG